MTVCCGCFRRRRGPPPTDADPAAPAEPVPAAPPPPVSIQAVSFASAGRDTPSEPGPRGQRADSASEASAEDDVAPPRRFPIVVIRSAAENRAEKTATAPPLPSLAPPPPSLGSKIPRGRETETELKNRPVELSFDDLLAASSEPAQPSNSDMARSLRGEDGDGGLGASEGAEVCLKDIFGSPPPTPGRIDLEARCTPRNHGTPLKRQGDDEDGALGAWEGAAAREEVCLKDIFGSPPPTPGRIDLEARHTRHLISATVQTRPGL